MDLSKFTDWAVDNFGKNYGYNAETSTEIQIPKETLHDIYKGLYQKYDINNLFLISHYCNTCFENDNAKPYHLGTMNVYEHHEEENEEIQQAIAGITPSENAALLREAYSFSNIVVRVAEGLENARFIHVEQNFFDKIKSLAEEEIDALLTQYKDFIVPVAHLEKGNKYFLTDSR